MAEKAKNRELGGIALSEAILDALARRHPGSEWIFVSEVALPGGRAGRRLDAVAMAYWPSRNFIRHIYEVKISRQDFLREIKAPKKRQFALESGECFWFAAPAGLIKTDELPPEAGLLEFDETGLHLKVSAPVREVLPANPEFMLALCRRAAHGGRRDAARIKGIPGWNVIISCLNIAIGKGRMASDTARAGLGLSLIHALRDGGYGDEALVVDRIVREGRDFDRRWHASANIAVLKQLELDYPLPDACPKCGAQPARGENSIFDFRCTACDWTDSAVRVRRLKD